MQRNFNTYEHIGAERGVLATNKVIRNTYLLLSLTILFSAATAAFSMAYNINMPFFAVLGGYMGLLFLTQATANTSMGILSVFAFTGFLGLTLGPMLNYYIHSFSNGSQLVSASLASTGTIFLALSGYAISTKKDFSYMGGFLFVVLTVVVLASLANIFFAVPMIHLGISCAMVLLMSGYILYETSLIIHGGQNNYILATVSLYISLLNLFTSLLHIFASFAGNRD